MKALKIIFILLIAGLLAFLVYKGVQKYKRKKLAEALVDFAKTKGIKMDEKELVKSFDRLNDIEIDQLISFAKDVENRKFGKILMKITTILPILKKINYLAVIDKI